MINYALVYFLKNNTQNLDTIRRKYDPMVDIIQPHVTLIFPIAVSQIEESLLKNHIQEKIQLCKPFTVQFSGFKKSWDNYLFLTTTLGTQEIVALHELLYTGILNRFLSKNVNYLPHVTLGVFDNNPKLYEIALKEAKQKKIFITELFDKVSLIKGDGKSFREVIQEFSLE